MPMFRILGFAAHFSFDRVLMPAPLDEARHGPLG